MFQVQSHEEDNQQPVDVPVDSTFSNMNIMSYCNKTFTCMTDAPLQSFTM